MSELIQADVWQTDQCAFIHKNGRRCAFVGTYLKGNNDIKKHFCLEHNTRIK